MPVWLVATDGFSAGVRLVHFVLNVHRIDGRSCSRDAPPPRAEELPAFVAPLHADLAPHLATLRVGPELAALAG